MNIFNQHHFTPETLQLLQNLNLRDGQVAKKLIQLLCHSNEIQFPTIQNTKIKSNEYMESLIQKPRNIFQQCSEKIYDIFGQMDNQIIINAILDHLHEHSCINVLMLFYKGLQNSGLKQQIYQDGYLTEIIENFENALNSPNSIYLKLSKSTTGDFHMNFTQFLLTHYPTVYSKEQNLQPIQQIQEKSFQVEPQIQQNKNFKIPPLKLPQNSLEIVGIMTRSTRRADPFKSYSTCSNRFSHSIDSAIKFTSGSQAIHKEEDQSYKLNAKEELQNLAQLLGSYCLTQDLSCLLLKQRRQQLESLTRLGINKWPNILNQCEDPLAQSFEQDQNKYQKSNKICRLWGNILYLILKDIKKIQYELCPYSTILNYLCSNSFQKNKISSKQICQDFDTDIYSKKQLCDQSKLKSDNGLISEQKIYFLILDLFNSDQQHIKIQQDSYKEQSFEIDESERSIESPYTVANIPEMMIPVKNELQRVVCNYRHSNTTQFSFLKHIQYRFNFILNTMNMDDNAFYELEYDLLAILEKYLSYTHNRILLSQFLDYMLEILVMIKRQIIDIINCQLSSSRTPNQSQYISKSAKHYSQTITNMFKSINIFETSPDQKSTQLQTQLFQQQQQFQPSQLKFSSQQQQQLQQQQQQQHSNLKFKPQKPFIKKYPQIISTYISIISRLFLRAINDSSIKFLLNVFVNEIFLEMIKNFSSYIFQELNQNKEENFELHAMRILLFYESILILFQKHDKEYKQQVRIFQGFLNQFLKILQKFIEHHTYLLQKPQVKRVHVYKKAFEVIGISFQYPNEELSNVMIRYCYVNFIKLYSQSNLNDLKEINMKIQEFNQKQELSSKQDEKQSKQFSQIFMNLYIKCLLCIAQNRSEDISRKFYQYRIVEFLTQEIDLEFDITQIREKPINHQSLMQQQEQNSQIDSSSNNERLSSKLSDRPNVKLNLQSVHKQQLEQIQEENQKQTKKNSQILLKKVLVPTLDLEGKLKTDNFSSQSYSHSPQFNTSSKQQQNLTVLQKVQPDEVQQNHKRGNSMPFKSEICIQAQLSESQRRMLLQKNINLNSSDKKQPVPKLNLPNCQQEKELQPQQQQQQLKLNICNQAKDDLFYLSERKLRKIYSDEELHANCLSLLICLLIKPIRGILDDLYCSQHPIINGKPNILFLLHHHLNNSQNQNVIKLVLQKITNIKIIRLLKLLCIQLFDKTQYTDWQKIASGAYGVIYQCKTNLKEPEYVAIKQMGVPKSIYERCVLYGLFTEIACMENFRLNPQVATLYDYGVTSSDYIIVMKKYPYSLKEWRQQQKGSLQENLGVYLSLYKQVLQAVQMLHHHNITHYDIKADNILLDDMHVVLTDFGESSIFINEEDEYCVRNRGTEYIKSPEMLTLTINSKKEQDTYDRRKKVGTTRSSDVWSLGCLLFEILTGELLFYKKEWVQFYLQVTQPTEQLISEDKQQLLGNNFYIIDFLKYVLVRDQKHRPNIESVQKRFEHVHALLVTNNEQKITQQTLLNTKSFDLLLEDYHKLVYYNDKKVAFEQTQPIHLSFFKVTQELFICDQNYFKLNQEKLIEMGITNVISDSQQLKASDLYQFQYIIFSLENIAQLPNYVKAAQLVPHMLDYLRQILLHKGKLLIVENHSSYLRQALLLTLSYFFRINAYEVHNIFNNQLLFFNISNLPILNILSIYSNQLTQHLFTYPRLQCICGCVTFILKRDFNDEKRTKILQCHCHGNMLCNGGAGMTKGCSHYLKFLRKRYKISWEFIKWGQIDLEAFLIGPFNKGSIRQESKIQILLSSMGSNHNLVNNQSTTDWNVYQCNKCDMWMIAYNRQSHELLVIMNNLYRKNHNKFFSDKFKLPNLKNFSLLELK
ncbi:unnamed protein product [Paramecium sonneborni]|uniref:Protein kinase domain-containing protein n=1 Tax=Paramecium sonneborni TaxID=65129 RepID=A0A8S1LMN2_9CILI|nr:unnamed protein product [Paramecium sonneborni]